MKNLLFRLLVAGIILMSKEADGQLAITETMSSASTNLGSAFVAQGPDFWELTNFGTNAIELTGYVFNDADAIRGGDADSTTLAGVTIGPGESIILAQTGTAVSNRDDFINWWGAANVPTDLQVLFYTGNGQSGSGDSIVLWAPTATSDADFVDRADYGEALRGHSFTYDPSNGAYGNVSTNGIGGAFKAVTSDDEGSPGYTTGPVPIKITQQPAPANLTMPAGQNATFTIAAQGLPHAHYQWRLNEASIDGAIQSSLTLTNVQLSDAGEYSVVVTNGLQALTSSNAVLTVTTSPVSPAFITVPANADAFIGQAVQFAAQVNGSPTPALQWEKDSVAIPGATSAQLTLFGVQRNDAGVYTLVAGSTAGTNSASAVLTVGDKPRLLITEVQPSGSAESGHADWWELTSFDTRTFNLKGWRWDDDSHNVINAYTFTNDTVIHPGETVIFTENITAAQFKAWWGTNLPPNLQVFTYGGAGLGLSQTRDEVNLWNAVTLSGNELSERICGVNFAVSYINTTLVYEPENPPVAGVFSVFSTNTVAGAAANGIFQAAQLYSLGSPGYVIAPISLAASQSGRAISLTWNSAPNRAYAVEYKSNLLDPGWTVLSNLTATATSTTVTDAMGSSARIYRVGAVIPVVSEP